MTSADVHTPTPPSSQWKSTSTSRCFHSLAFYCCGTNATFFFPLPSLPILSSGVGYLSKTGQKSGTRRLVRPSTGLFCCFDLAGQWSPLLDSPGLTRDDWLFSVGGTSLLMDKEVHTQSVGTLLWTACTYLSCFGIQSHFHFQHFRTDYGECTRIQKEEGHIHHRSGRGAPFRGPDPPPASSNWTARQGGAVMTMLSSVTSPFPRLSAIRRSYC